MVLLLTVQAITVCHHLYWLLMFLDPHFITDASLINILTLSFTNSSFFDLNLYLILM